MSKEEIEVLHRIIKQAKAPVWLAGMGTMGASSELRALEDVYPLLRFATTPRAKGIFPEDDERCLGVNGFCGEPRSDKFIQDQADVLIVSGSRLGETSGSGWKTGEYGVSIVRIDVALRSLRKLASTVLEIERDVQAVLRGLLERAQQCADSTAVTTAIRAHVPATLDGYGDQLLHDEIELELRTAPPKLGCVHPLEGARSIQRAVPIDTPIYCDIGNTKCWLIRYLKRRQPRTWHVNLVLGAMGYAIPAAAGGALALGKPVLAALGDGAFLMSCGELATLSRLALPVVVVCFSNGTHGTVDLGCKKLFPDTLIPQMSLASGLDVVGVARAMGVDGQRFTSGLHLEQCLVDALASCKPYVIDIAIDAEIEAPIAQRLTALSTQFVGARQA